MKNRVLFYSSVKNKELFSIQRFYHIDIELLKELGFDVHLSNSILDFFCFWKYDVAFIYFYRYGLFAAILSKVFCKSVYFTGGIDNLEKSTTRPKDYIIQKYFFKLCNVLADKCILVSVSDQNNVKKIYKKKLPKNLCLSHHTIDVEKFISNDLVKQHNIFSTISWMGSIDNVYRKGIDKVLLIFKGLLEKKEYSDAVLYIVGAEGEGSDYLKKLILDLGIVDNVIFTGSIDEKQKIDFLKLSKVYFQLSVYEGFGIAALEALAAGAIVVHSGNGGLSETIKDYGVKIHFENNLRENLEDKAEIIYNEILNFNPEKLVIAQKYVKDNFSNERRLNDFKNIFKS